MPRAVLQTENNPLGAIFFRVYADPLGVLLPTDKDVLSPLDYQSDARYYVLSRMRNDGASKGTAPPPFFPLHPPETRFLHRSPVSQTSPKKKSGSPSRKANARGAPTSSTCSIS
jgi:hypothetical protein